VRQAPGRTPTRKRTARAWRAPDQGCGMAPPDIREKTMAQVRCLDWPTLERAGAPAGPVRSDQGIAGQKPLAGQAMGLKSKPQGGLRCPCLSTPLQQGWPSAPHAQMLAAPLKMIV
jgi:hypothetical protein